MEGCSYEILVVDDGSEDRTAEEAKKNNVRLIHHPYNIGNGAAVKTGIRHACGKVIVLMDGDGQHNPDDISCLLEFIPEYDMVVGARTPKSESALHRNLANKVYNMLAGYLTRIKILDLTSGFRAIKTDLAKRFVYLLPNTFSYPTTITLSMLRAGFSVKYVPIKASRRVGTSKIHIFRDGVEFILIMLKVATLFSPLRVFIPISIVSILLGLVYGAYMILVHTHFSNMILFLLITGVLVFHLGLIAEQIAMLRLERSEE
jgi:glycosyltransferase involved in cell wall biosynthesis